MWTVLTSRTVSACPTSSPVRAANASTSVYCVTTRKTAKTEPMSPVAVSKFVLENLGQT